LRELLLTIYYFYYNNILYFLDIKQNTLGESEINRAQTLDSRTEVLLEQFNNCGKQGNQKRVFSGKIVSQMRTLILDNDLEENEDFCDARDYILKLVELDITHQDIPQVLYVMMTHIMYYDIWKENRINAQNRDIQKTLATVKSLCQFALGEKKRG